MLEEYAKENYIEIKYLKKKLAENNIHFNYLKEYLINEDIYNTDYQMFSLESTEQCFVRESLLSKDCQYNEKLFKRITKAKMLNKDYIIDSEKSIYIINREIKQLNLNEHLGIPFEELDFRRLAECKKLQTIKLSNNLKSITYLYTIKKMTPKLKIYYDIDSCNEAVNEQILKFDEEFEVFIPYSTNLI